MLFCLSGFHVWLEWEDAVEFLVSHTTPRAVQHFWHRWGVWLARWTGACRNDGFILFQNDPKGNSLTLTLPAQSTASPPACIQSLHSSPLLVAQGSLRRHCLELSRAGEQSSCYRLQSGLLLWRPIGWDGEAWDSEVPIYPSPFPHYNSPAPPPRSRSWPKLNAKRLQQRFPPHPSPQPNLNTPKQPPTVLQYARLHCPERASNQNPILGSVSEPRIAAIP